MSVSLIRANGRIRKEFYDLRLFIKKMRCVFNVFIFNLIANKMAMERKKEDERKFYANTKRRKR